MAKETFGVDKYILIAQDSDYVALPAQIKGTAGTTIKAGTPLVGNIADRDTGFTAGTAGEGGTVATASCALLHDVTIPTGATSVNGVIVIQGTIDLLKLDSDVVALATSATGLTNVKYVKGAK